MRLANKTEVETLKTAGNVRAAAIAELGFVPELEAGDYAATTEQFVRWAGLYGRWVLCSPRAGRVHCSDCGNPDCPKVDPDPYFAYCPAVRRATTAEPVDSFELVLK